MSIFNSYREAIWAGMEPPPNLNLPEYTEREIYIPQAISARSGQMSLDSTPYLREPMEMLSGDNPAREICIMGGTQIGKTLMYTAWLDYLIRVEPCPILLIMPTEDACRSYAKMKLDPLLEANEKTKIRLKESRGRESGSSLLFKEFAGGCIKIIWSNSPNAYRQFSAQVVIIDDADDCSRNVDGQGKSTELARKRTDSYSGNEKVLIISTPTLEGSSNIGEEYQESDQREWHFGCPECGELNHLPWHKLKFSYDTNYQRTSNVTASCEHCGTVFEDYRKYEKAGKWIPANPGHPKIGYKMPSTLSSTVTWNKIADEWLGYKRNNTSLKEWTNTRLAEVWKENQNTNTSNVLMMRAEPLGLIIPRGAYVVTAGVDTGRWGMDIGIYAWGRNYEHWCLDHRTLEGDTLENPIWEKLYNELITMYPWADTGISKRAAVSFVDTGGGSVDKNNPMITSTFMAYKFVQGKEHLGIYGIKGMPGYPAGKYIGNRTLQNLDTKGGNKDFGTIPLVPVYVDKLKDLLKDRLEISEPGPNYLHFPDWLPLSYYDGLTVEYKNDKGKWTRPRGSYNEPGDCYVYAAAALESMPFPVHPLSKDLPINQYCDMIDRQMRAAGVQGF